MHAHANSICSLLLIHIKRGRLNIFIQIGIAQKSIGLKFTVPRSDNKELVLNISWTRIKHLCKIFPISKAKYKNQAPMEENFKRIRRLPRYESGSYEERWTRADKIINYGIISILFPLKDIVLVSLDSENPIICE